MTEATTSTSLNATNQEELARLTQLAKEHVKQVHRKIPALGAVTWLMLQQGLTRHTLLSELEWRVMPGLVLDQAKLYLKDEAPIAFVSWAKLSEEAAQRYRQAPHHLMPSDWKSGEQVWLVDVFTPYGGAQDLLKDLREKVLPGQVIHQLVPAGAGQEARVLSWPVLGVAATPAAST